MAIIIDHSKARFTEVTLMKEEEFPLVVKTLRTWKHYLEDYLSRIEPCDKARAIACDYQVVITLFQEDMWKIKKLTQKIVMLAKDNFERIQAMACFIVNEGSGIESKNIKLKELLSAPWNLRWPVSPFAYPLLGGGVLILQSLIIYAGKNEVKKIHLSSTTTAMNFYKNLGFHNEGINLFVLRINPENCAKIQEVFNKYFKIEDVKESA